MGIRQIKGTFLFIGLSDVVSQAKKKAFFIFYDGALFIDFMQDLMYPLQSPGIASKLDTRMFRSKFEFKHCVTPHVEVLRNEAEIKSMLQEIGAAMVISYLRGFYLHSSAHLLSIGPFQGRKALSSPAPSSRKVWFS